MSQPHITMGCAFSSDHPRDGRGAKDPRHYSYQPSTPHGPPNYHRKRHQHYKNNIQQQQPPNVPSKKGGAPTNQSLMSNKSAKAQASPLKASPKGVDSDFNPSQGQPVRGMSPDLKDEDIHFRRQHFDRNSVLRHSKKRTRKASSASASSKSNTPNKNQETPKPISVTNPDRDNSLTSSNDDATSHKKTTLTALEASSSIQEISSTPFQSNQILTDDPTLQDAKSELNSSHAASVSRLLASSNKPMSSSFTSSASTLTTKTSSTTRQQHSKVVPAKPTSALSGSSSLFRGRGQEEHRVVIPVEGARTRRGATPERRAKTPERRAKTPDRRAKTPTDNELENPLEDCGRLI